MAENGAQLFARLEGRRSLRDLEAHIFPKDAGLNQGDVVEFHGTEGTGKTELLYHLVTRCILPADTGGLEVEVLYVDTDYHFDMLRLVTILEQRLAQPGEGAREGDSEERVRACLERLSVVHCSSSVQLLLTLTYLETTFCSRPALCLLVIDSISSSYWVDRSGGGESLAKQEVNLQRCADLLARFLRDYGITLFATTHAIMRNYGHSTDTAAMVSGSSDTAPSSWRRCSDFDKPYLCRAWQRLVTHRLLLSKVVNHISSQAEQTNHRQVSSAEGTNHSLFSAVCTTTRTRCCRSSSFCVTEGGVQFL